MGCISCADRILVFRAYTIFHRNSLRIQRTKQPCLTLRQTSASIKIEFFRLFPRDGLTRRKQLCGQVPIGRRFFHSGSIWILSILSSHLTMPCWLRNCESSMSLAVCVLTWPASSWMLCHSPSLRMSKSFSTFNFARLIFLSGRI